MRRKTTAPPVTALRTKLPAANPRVQPVAAARPPTSKSPSSPPNFAQVEWSPYAAWVGDKAAERCELAMYALLWLDTVAIQCHPHLRSARCAELLDHTAWDRVAAQRAEPIPMAALVESARRGSEDVAGSKNELVRKGQIMLHSASEIAGRSTARVGKVDSGGGVGSVHGSGAMAVLGPAVYAWAQYEQMLHGMPADWCTSWRNAELTPRQLFLYLEACLDPGKRGARIRGHGGSACRWEEPAIAAEWQHMLFETAGMRENLLGLLAMPLHEAQRRAFERRTRRIAERAQVMQRQKTLLQRTLAQEQSQIVQEHRQPAQVQDRVEHEPHQLAQETLRARSASFVQERDLRGLRNALVFWRARAAWYWQFGSARILAQMIARRIMRRDVMGAMKTWKLVVKEASVSRSRMRAALDRLVCSPSKGGWQPAGDVADPSGFVEASAEEELFYEDAAEEAAVEARAEAKAIATVAKTREAPSEEAAESALSSSLALDSPPKSRRTTEDSIRDEGLSDSRSRADSSATEVAAASTPPDLEADDHPHHHEQLIEHDELPPLLLPPPPPPPPVVLTAQAASLLAAQRNAERVAAALEELVDMHGRRLADGLPSPSRPTTRTQPALPDVPKRAEWFELQLVLEGMQTSQAAAIECLVEARAVEDAAAMLTPAPTLVLMPDAPEPPLLPPPVPPLTQQMEAEEAALRQKKAEREARKQRREQELAEAAGNPAASPSAKAPPASPPQQTPPPSPALSLLSSTLSLFSPSAAAPVDEARPSEAHPAPEPAPEPAPDELFAGKGPSVAQLEDALDMAEQRVAEVEAEAVLREEALREEAAEAVRKTAVAAEAQVALAKAKVYAAEKDAKQSLTDLNAAAQLESSGSALAAEQERLSEELASARWWIDTLETGESATVSHMSSPAPPSARSQRLSTRSLTPCMPSMGFVQPWAPATPPLPSSASLAPRASAEAEVAAAQLSLSPSGADVAGQSELLGRELGLSGNTTEVIDRAAAQLGVETEGKSLAEIAQGCVEALGRRRDSGSLPLPATDGAFPGAMPAGDAVSPPAAESPYPKRRSVMSVIGLPDLPFGLPFGDSGRGQFGESGRSTSASSLAADFGGDSVLAADFGGDGLLRQPVREHEEPPLRQMALNQDGVLRVRLHSASGLKAADWNGKSDPYVVVRSGKVEARSKVVHMTLAPVWEEDLQLHGTLGELLARGLLLQVYDHDGPLKLKKDDHLGDVQISLQDLRHATAHFFEEELSTQGTLRFDVSFHRFVADGLTGNGSAIITGTR